MGTELVVHRVLLCVSGVEAGQAFVNELGEDEGATTSSVPTEDIISRLYSSLRNSPSGSIS